MGYFKTAPLCAVRFNSGGIKYRGPGRGHRIGNLEPRAIVTGTGSLVGRGSKLALPSVFTVSLPLVAVGDGMLGRVTTLTELFPSCFQWTLLPLGCPSLGFVTVRVYPLPFHPERLIKEDTIWYFFFITFPYLNRSDSET